VTIDANTRLAAIALLAVAPAPRLNSAHQGRHHQYPECHPCHQGRGESARSHPREVRAPIQGLEARMANQPQARDLQKSAIPFPRGPRQADPRNRRPQKKYQWDAEDFQGEVQQEEQKLVGEIGNRMISIIDEFSKAANFALVLDVSSQQSPVLWPPAGLRYSRHRRTLRQEHAVAPLLRRHSNRQAGHSHAPLRRQKPAGVK